MERFFWRPGPAETGAQGVSVAQSVDGGLRLTVLGDSEALRTAQLLLERYAIRGAAVAAADMPEVGYVIENCVNGNTQVVASPVGLKQIFWSGSAGKLALASEPAALANRSTTSGLSADVLFQYIYFHCIPGPASAFTGISKLDAGHSLHWEGGQARVTRYWYPSFAPRSDLDLSNAAQELHGLLESAVNRSLQRGHHCGAFLSGGLDSSTVSGVAARLQAGIPTVSMGFDAAGYDEMSYARIASRHFATKPLEYYVTPEDVVRSLPDVAAAFAEPFGNSSAAAAYHCARIARENGIDMLLAGDGGDELFGGNDRYATQLVFERYARVPAVARALIESTVQMAATVTRRFPVGKAQSYIRQAKTPLPDRLQEYNFLHRIPPGDVFDGDLLRGVDVAVPLQLLRDEYEAPVDADAIGRMLFLDWKFTLHDNDLVKVNTMCELAGVQVGYPMLDPGLIEFSLRLPSDWKVRNGQLRWFYKQAMRGFLPREIIDKTKHGFGLPFGAWTRTHAGLQEMSAAALDSLARRRYFRPGFIAEAQRLHRLGHASYYGELVWLLMVLELWLQRHMPRAGL